MRLDSSPPDESGLKNDKEGAANKCRLQIVLNEQGHEIGQYQVTITDGRLTLR